jgi:hypothetical protein
MPTEPGARPFHRRLPWSVVVRLDGVYDDADEPDPAVEDPAHPPGRVVVELPDFAADSLAHMIELVWDVAEQLTDGAGPAVGPARDLAEALHLAVLSQPGYRCRGLGHRPATEGRATPKALRAALRPKAAARFDQEFRAALTEAAQTFDLTAVNACVHRWRLAARSSAGRATGRQLQRQAG